MNVSSSADRPVSSSVLNFRIFNFMKTTILSLCMAFAFALNAQFIPQPMGYNPDSNSDGYIGSADLVGLLALYGNAFGNNDSIQVVELSFIGSETDTLEIPEYADVVVVHHEFVNPDSYGHEHWYFKMPSDESFKTMLVLPRVNQTNSELSEQFAEEFFLTPYFHFLDSCNENSTGEWESFWNSETGSWDGNATPCSGFEQFYYSYGLRARNSVHAILIRSFDGIWSHSFL